MVIQLRMLLAAGFAAALCLGNSDAGDWPTWRHDAARTGYTDETLEAPENFQLLWEHHQAAPARPAWPRSERMTFDRSPPLIAAQGMVFFGDSVDGSIHALDSATGETRWVFPTRAPVRFAPCYFEGKIFAGSDDGFLYCLNSDDGSLRWKKRGGPSDEMILGNDRMISRWPMRGGAVVLDGVLYFAAGIWPSDGVSLYALDPATGETLWVNDTAGSIYLGQPHGGAFAKSGVAAQGYLVASEKQIFMATGRAVPAAFDRKAGEFQYLSLQANTHRGGAEVMLSDRFFINGAYAFEQTDSALNGSVPKGPKVITPEGFTGVYGSKVTGLKWIDKETLDRKGQPSMVRTTEEFLSLDWDSENGSTSAVGAGRHLIVGGEGVVSIADVAEQGGVIWSEKVKGEVHALAIADQRVFATTDEGKIYCFGKGSGKPQIHRAPEITWKTEADSVFAKAAEEIVRRGKISSGYALDLGCGDGQLLIELAKRTDLFCYGIESDPTKVEQARENLIAAGLYGSRVMVLEADPADSQLPNYFANLIVSAASLDGSLAENVLAEASRVSRPWGGTLITGKPGAMMAKERGELKGAGQWTHQYADPANTVNSGDELIRGPLGMLWFSDLKQKMTQRHGRGPAPLFNKGVLYSEGLDELIAVDAYNGHRIWSYSVPGILDAYDGDHLMGTSGTGSNYCVSDDSVYVRMEDHCLRIDARTGKLLATFKAPRSNDSGKTVWGYLAHHEGVLFGTVADPEHVPTFRYRPGGDMNQQLTESKIFFALDARSGELLWRYDAEHSLRQNAIAIGNKAVVLIDRPQALFDRDKEGKATEDNHPTGQLIAFDAHSGDELWRNDEDIFGTVAAISSEHHSVMMSYQPTRFRLASEIGGRLAVFDLSDGKLKWQAEADYESRPVLNGDTIYAQGGAWDVLTGDDRPFNFKRSYGCGILAGARDLFVFRSATLGYFDLTKNVETEDYGGIRPGCWINAIPAGGLVFAPDASAGCKCSYLNQSWIALQNTGVRAPRIEASAISDPREATVRLIADSAATKEIRYTLDGSAPTSASNRYEDGLVITESASIRARAFDGNNQPSQVVEQDILIDPFLVSIDESRWRTLDPERISPTSDWRIEQGVFTQTSNAMVGGKPTLVNTPKAERPGTMYLFDNGKPFGNGELSFEIQSTDNDALGFVIRHRDPENFYLWSISSERPYRALAVKAGEGYEVIDGVDAGYAPRTWHRVRMVFANGKVTVFFDGEQDFSIEDPEGAGLGPGQTIGFYSWGNSGSRFRKLRFVPAE
jgi:outer membrane protein assembly factor BamB